MLALIIGVAVGYFLFGVKPENESLVSAKSEEAPVHQSEDASTGSKSEDPAGEQAGSLSAEWIESLDSKNPIEQYAAISAVLTQLSPRDYRRIFNGLSVTTSNMGWHIRDIVGRHWAATDPRGMLAYVNSAEGAEQQSLRGLVFREWARVDFDQAWAEAMAMAMPEGSIKKRMIGVVLGVGADYRFSILPRIIFCENILCYFRAEAQGRRGLKQ